MTINVDPSTFTYFEVSPMSLHIGAELLGLKLSADMPEQAYQQIKQALLEYKVVFFRDQGHLTAEEHIAFARHFGELEIHPATPKDQPNPEILRITHDDTSKGRENAWHSDVTWRPEPSLGSILRAVEVPPYGGDTLFSCMYAAYDALSPAMKDWVCGLTAVHDISRVFADRLKTTADELRAKFPPQEHPVVRTHPETGRRGLYVNTAFTDHIKGLSRTESDWLLSHLYSFAAIPEHQCRFRWEAGSMAFWDNRACQHYAASDYFPQKRVMERVTICGDRPYFRA